MSLKRARSSRQRAGSICAVRLASFKRSMTRSALEFDDVTHALAFLASPLCRNMTGETLTVADRGEAELGAAISVVIHKPIGIVSAQPDPGQTPAARLLIRPSMVGDGIVPSPKASLPPLGRLDQDSHGLLILSEDGVLAKAVIGPESQVDKEYVVTVRGHNDRPKIAASGHAKNSARKPTGTATRTTRTTLGAIRRVIARRGRSSP